MQRKKYIKKYILTIIIVISLLVLIGIVNIIAVNINYISNSALNLNKYIVKNYSFNLKTDNNDNLNNTENIDNGVYIDVYVPSSPINKEDAIAISTLEEAYQYILDNENDGGIIHITKNINVDGININTNKKITIKSDEDAYTIAKDGSKKNMFSVTNGGSLILENIIVDATNNTEGRTVILENNSVLTLNENAILENNNSYGAVFAYSSSVKINGGIIRDNHTTNGINVNQNAGHHMSENFEGGAIFYAHNSSLEMNNGEVSNNSAKNGGAIYGVNPQNMIINGGIFSNNKTVDQDKNPQYGGAIGVWNADNCTISITGKTVFSNNNGQTGGSLFIYGHNTIINMDGAEFTDIVGTQYGGAINCQCDNSKMTLTNCNFRNTSGLAGGAIYLNQGIDVDINNCTFENNTAMAGGAIAHQGFNYKLSIKDSSFIGNKATALIGGAIFAGDNSQGKSEVILENCIFDGNKTQDNGGAVFVKSIGTQDSSLFITKCTFQNNEAVTGSGGAIHTTNIKNISINNCEIIGNKAKTKGGGINIYNDDNVNEEYKLIEINGVKFSKNRVSIDGGGLNISAQYANIIIDKGTEFSENTASANGGGLWIGRIGEESGNINVMMEECNIINNISLGDPSTYKEFNPDDERRFITLQHYNAGGMFIGEYVTLYMNNALITNNSIESGYKENIVADGVGLCPNAEAYFYEDGNISIYGNGTNGMDILAVPYDEYVYREDLPRLYISDKTADGRDYNWTNLKGGKARTGNYNWDKALENIGNSLDKGEETTALAESSNSNSQTTLDEYEGEETLDPVGFKANMADSEMKVALKEDDGYKVHIMGNISKSATYGAGGLMVNGKVIASNFAITVEKKIDIKGEASNEKRTEINNKEFNFKIAIESKRLKNLKTPKTSGKNLTKTELESNSSKTEAIVWEQSDGSSIGFNFTLKGNQKMRTDEINREDIGIDNTETYNFIVEETDNGGANEVNIVTENNDYELSNSEISNFIFTCTNTFKFGGLNITKNVESVGNKDKMWTFNIHVDSAEGEYFAELWENNGKVKDMSVTFTSGNASVQLKHNQTLKIKDLPVNVAYSVSEVDTDESYIVSSTGENGTISDESIAEVVFTNTIKTGGLSVSKTVTGNAGDVDRDWNFTVTLDDTTINGQYGDMTFENGIATFTLKHGEIKHANGLPEGVKYKVEEQEANKDNYTTTSEGTEGEISSAKDAEVKFNNEKNEVISKTGGFSVSKTVVGTEKNKDEEFEFTVTLDDTTINGQYGDMTFKNGIATFTLKDGEEKRATELPVNVKYEVEEKQYSDYITKSTNEKGVIEESKTTNVKFVNTKKDKTVAPGTLPSTGSNDPLSIVASLILGVIAVTIISFVLYKKYSKF